MEKYKDDPKFQEFLQAHKHKSGEAWTNDSVIQVASLYGAEKENDKAEEAEANANLLPEGGGNESGEKKAPKHDFFHVKLANLPYKFKKRHVKAFLEPLKPPSVRIPPKIHGIAFVGFKTEKERNQALNKHKSLYEGQQIFVYKHEQKEAPGNVNDPSRSAKWVEQEAGIASSETVGESGRIFVRNLSYAVTEDEMRDLFSKFGPLTEVNLPVDKLTRRSKGFAFVTFMMPEHAVQAFSELDGSSYQGRLLHLIPGKAKEESDEGKEESMGYKQKKEREKKSSAGSSHNWNSLFLGASAVADLMSEKYNVAKADVVLGDGGGGQSAAVRLALGETQIIQETKKYLEEEGISLAAFDKPPKVRSKTVIIAKNLPANTAGHEIRDIFGKFGVLGRVVMPPGGITAVIEFSDPGEARAAFTNLAYTRFHNSPLYLEWAPQETFTSAFAEKPVPPAPSANINEPKKEDEMTDQETPETDSTLFVKNLNFETKDEALRDHFSKCGNIFSANVATKKDLASGQTLSMGFGFVTFWQRSSADRALKELQHSRLDSHALELKRSNRAPDKEAKSERKSGKAAGSPSTKLLVRNVAFQATKQELTEIFKTYGELTSVRLPSKMSGTGSHRGFAFVEFASKSDAKKAMEELSGSTHLYGRRLVLEWAEQDDSLETLRKRTADQFNSGNQVAANKRKKFQLPAKSADGND